MQQQRTANLTFACLKMSQIITLTLQLSLIEVNISSRHLLFPRGAFIVRLSTPQMVLCVTGFAFLNHTEP